ncbi:MAG: hypothetical protein Q4G05_02400 [Clostridia bacterium]|nr:hypothetical protein [Clostridia bacterium]
MDSNLRIKEIYEEDVNNTNQVYDQVAYDYRGAGTYGDPYKIRYVEDLVDLEISVNGGENKSGEYFELTSNLDFKQDSSYKDPTNTEYGDINGDSITDSIKTELIKSNAAGFIPIGNSTTKFAGTFNREWKDYNKYCTE